MGTTTTYRHNGTMEDCLRSALAYAQERDCPVYVGPGQWGYRWETGEFPAYRTTTVIDVRGDNMARRWERVLDEAREHLAWTPGEWRRLFS